MPRIRAACVAGCSLAALVVTFAAGCESSAGPAPVPRSWRMGFSPIPPQQDPTVVFQSLETWTKRADSALGPKPALAVWDRLYQRPLR